MWQADEMKELISHIHVLLRTVVANLIFLQAPSVIHSKLQDRSYRTDATELKLQIRFLKQNQRFERTFIGSIVGKEHVDKGGC